MTDRSTSLDRALRTIRFSAGVAPFVLGLTPLTAGSAVAQEEITVPAVTVEVDRAAAPKPKKPRPVRPRPATEATPIPAPSGPVAAAPSAAESGAGTAAPVATTIGGGASGTTLGSADRAERGLGTNDTAALISSIPGGSAWGAGGVSSLPAINGMGADRVQVSVGGMLTSPACPNEMNPTLSYVSPDMVGKLHAHSAAAPVSAGGDFSGGRITVEAATPTFAPTTGGLLVSGSIASFYRSISHAVGVDAHASVANADTALTYSGSWARASNYRSGDRTEMLSTEYQTQNHSLQLVRRFDASTFTLQAGGQYMPYQGFPSQAMDMTLNKSAFVNGKWEGDTDWGKVEATGYGHWVRHGMNLLGDKLNWPTFDGTQAIMPMDTNAADFGGSVKATIPFGKADVLRLGAELHLYRINDWWDALDPDPSGMMSPYTFINLNNATRNRLGVFAEWERKWDAQWTSIVGLRFDGVRMNTGPVHGYGDLDPALDFQYGGDADVFNAAKRARTDLALDGSGTLRWEPTAGQTFELGIARKTRAPNLYERYSWSTNIMAMQMTGWFGDGNGYVGNLDLKPEVNHAINLTATWRDTASDRWEFGVNPYYSYVADYIDADRCASSNLAGGFLNTRCGQAFFMTATDRYVYLRFANHDAHLFGVNASGRTRLLDSADWGRFDLRGQASWVRGVRSDGVDLYNIMPLNGKIALEHKLGGWSSGIELQMVASKTQTSDVRNELPTSGYSLVNVRTGYERNNLRIDLGVDNLLDRNYALPLGGANLANYAGVAGQMASFSYGHPVLAPGRSFNTRLTLKF